MNLPAINLNWEEIWSPYSDNLYKEVLDSLVPGDVVLDIGAGDLRLTWRIAEKCKFVYALEIKPEIIRKGINSHKSQFPENLEVLNVDAREYPFPDGVTTGVLLMRHCMDVQLYMNKLKNAGATRLITNARWRLGVEIVDLKCPRNDYDDLAIGSFACLCGSVGFKPGEVNCLFTGIENLVNEVINCPECRAGQTVV